jgi:hypothetical protein
VVRPCVLRHRVTVITLCPLGEPEIAIGHEPPIEPWFAEIRSLAKFQESTALAPLENEPKETEEQSREEPLEQSRDIPAGSGLDIETKNFSATARGRSFFVDIPFYRTPYLTLRYVVRSGFINIYPDWNVSTGH